MSVLIWFLYGCAVVIDKDPITIELEKMCAIGKPYTEKVGKTTISKTLRDAPVRFVGYTITTNGDHLIAHGPTGEEIATSPDGSLVIEETGKHWAGVDITRVRATRDGKIEFFRHCGYPWKTPPVPEKTDSEGYHPGTDSKPAPMAFKGFGH